MTNRPFGLSSKVMSDQKPIDTDAPPKQDGPGLGDPAATDDTDGEQMLTAEQAKDSGLDGLEAGDHFTVTISGTVTSNDPDGGLKYTVDDASNGEKDDGESQPGGSSEESGEDGDFAQPKSSIEMGPGSLKL